MKRTRIWIRLVAAMACLAVALLPLTASAQSAADLKHRQKNKNDWRNLAYISGAAGVWGLLKHDNTLMFAGAAGALYSANRYEQDRKSQSKMERTRAEMFSRRSFVRGGHRYVRKTTYKHGKKYYYFQRVS